MNVKTMSYQLSRLVALFSAILLSPMLLAQDYTNSIVSTDFDFITKDDPSTFQKLELVSVGPAEMPDKRGSRELFQSAFEFLATFGDQCSISIFVEAKNREPKTARNEAMRFVHPLGKLPTVLKSGVKRLCVHNGGKDTSAFSDSGLIVVYSDNASVRIANHDLEETIFHESVHAAWDTKYANCDKWKRAQIKDGQFATLYAKSKPEREDLAESALFAYTISHHPERLPKSVREKLRSQIYYRILFVADLIPVDKPIHFSDTSGPETSDSIHPDEDQSQHQLSDIRKMGIAYDIISHCLLTDLKLSEERVQAAMKHASANSKSSRDLYTQIVRKLGVSESTLRASVLKNLYVNCSGNLPSDSFDRLLRNEVQSWEANPIED